VGCPGVDRPGYVPEGTVFVDCVNGDDARDGSTPERAKRTIDAARRELRARPIYVLPSSIPLWLNSGACDPAPMTRETEGDVER
jgi:hypothetical protein